MLALCEIIGSVERLRQNKHHFNARDMQTLNKRKRHMFVFICVGDSGRTVSDFYVVRGYALVMMLCI